MADTAAAKSEMGARIRADVTAAVASGAHKPVRRGEKVRLAGLSKSGAQYNGRLATVLSDGPIRDDGGAFDRAAWVAAAAQGRGAEDEWRWKVRVEDEGGGLQGADAGSGRVFKVKLKNMKASMNSPGERAMREQAYADVMNDRGTMAMQALRECPFFGKSPLDRRALDDFR